jgi:hypothetical protein
MLEGARPTALAAEIRALGEQAFALLEQGLGAYAVRATPGT